MKSIDLQSIVRKNIMQLQPYASARDEFVGQASIYLDANENPINTLYNRYPDPHQVQLKNRIAEIKKVQPQQIFLGNGSDEPIDLLIRAFCEPGQDNVLIPDPTYGMFAISAAINSVNVRTVRMTEDFNIDPAAMERAWDSNTKLLFLCSPNNPSGNLLRGESVKNILVKFPGVVVLDEAYIDFAEDEGFLPHLTMYERLVVLQTFSKAWGLAGIRLGMCFGNPQIIKILNTLKPPYNISSLTQSVALEYLKDEKKKDEWVREIRKQRRVMADALMTVPIVEKVYPSDANFLLVKVHQAQKTYQDLVRQGIIVRNRSHVAWCENCLRITVGTEHENKVLIDVLHHL